MRRHLKPEIVEISDRHAGFTIQWWNASEDAFEFQLGYSLAARGWATVDAAATELADYHAEGVVAYPKALAARIAQFTDNGWTEASIVPPTSH